MLKTHDPSKRNFMALAGTGMVGIAVGGVAAPVSQPGTPEPSCFTKPNIGTEIGIIQTTAIALKALLPNQAVLLDKIVKLSGDFNAAYNRGDFTSAKTFVNSLADNIATLISDVGAGSPRIQFLVAVIGIAAKALAALFNANATPAVMANMDSAADRLKVMGSAEAAAKALQAAKLE